MTAFQDPDSRILYFFRRGQDIAVICGYSFGGYRLQTDAETAFQGVFPCIKDRANEMPGELDLPVGSLFAGVTLDRSIISEDDFPPHSIIAEKFAKTNAPDVLEYVWQRLGGKIRE